MLGSRYAGALLVLAALGLGGCAAPSVTPVTLDDGAEGRVVDCSGWFASMDDCLEQAAEACDGDYKVMASTGQWLRSDGAESVLTEYDRALLIRCEEGEPAEAAPTQAMH